MSATSIKNYSYNNNNNSNNNSNNSTTNPRSKLFFDDLLLPSLGPTNNHTHSAPILPSILLNNNPTECTLNILLQKKANTAPASPTHYPSSHFHFHQKNNSYSTITPQASPIFEKSQLTSSSSSSQFRPYSLPSPFNNTSKSPISPPIHLLDRLPKLTPTTSNTSHITLTPLRHLQLLPDPRIQENSYHYPDTSEPTPYWKDNIITWCKEKNYQEYKHIMNQKGSTPRMMKLSSILEPKDQFQNLSNNSWHYTTPVTPPMSPQHNSPNLVHESSYLRSRQTSMASDETDDESVASEEEQAEVQTAIEFTPFISEKLVQTIKKQKLISNRHKKTNSFKALEVKRLLDNRDILSINSKSKTPRTHRISKRHSIGAAANNLVKRIDYQNGITSARSSSNSTTPTSSGHTTPRSQSPKRSRSSSPHKSAKYYKFAVDAFSPSSTLSTPSSRSRSRSRSSSPSRSLHLKTPTQNENRSVTTTIRNSSPTKKSRRRSSGTTRHHHHTIQRKCVSCHSSDSPCWRPSWSKMKYDQLCNSCGLRFKKTHTRCLNESCLKIPTKGELSIMKANGMETQYVEARKASVEGYRCLFCNYITETTV
ncbi:hypothetical protein NCAS_0A02650 [Naumovozyma castellii]|uniref:GATA-type domain-containing protein n=1 Tax=Naumovozyma castellii TaxID=27288 RepID=G0V5T5_NAUCA|nr:hypothetical protein NCAS_0A02650 [Naumovozyma castellii CBS 4309]CCC66823.1 hypothetical protein NCAS_0A02650 [Naumovozyma castellii CBS 4309]